jgi:UDP-N-acetylmuramoyl-tripeptide--D-alanyl-D-alanine ligase
MIPMALEDVAAAVGAAHTPPEGAVQVRRVTTDSRDVKPGDLFVAIRGERFDAHDFIGNAAAGGAVACICAADWLEAHGSTRGIPCLAVADTVVALGRLAAYYRRRVMRVSTVVVAVTGTNGKTTTKGMIDHVLSGSFSGRAAPGSYNNHIGVPLTLLSAGANDRYLVVEIGTNSPGEVAALAALASPDAAVVTSISEAHLQGLGGIDGVAAEKVSLLRYVRPNGLCVVNIDRPEVGPHLIGASRARLMTVGTNPAARLCVADARGDIRHTTFVLDGRYRVELPMPGMHHATNAAAAFAIGRWFGVAPEEIIERFRSFAPPDGRTRRIELAGVTVVDDTYNANPASMAAAVATLRRGAPGRRVLVMGDMLELGPDSASYHRETVRGVFEAAIDVLVTVGALTGEAARSVDDRCGTTRALCCADTTAACALLASTVQPGDTVWIKGSRAMAMDRIVRDLSTRLSCSATLA